MDSKKERRAEKKRYEKTVKITKALIGVTVILVPTALISYIILGVASQNKTAFVTTTTARTTTKGNNVTELSLGQYCTYNNQCPRYAFCSATCQCPLHYYVVRNNGSCTMRKTYGASCTINEECNINVGLICSTTCQCDSLHFWNSTYPVGGGVPNGRCQNLKNHGMACSAYEGGPYIWYTSSGYGSQIRRCYCETGQYVHHSLLYGKCMYPYKAPGEKCNHNVECYYSGNAICVDLNGDGSKTCISVPTVNWWSGYRAKLDINGSPCNSNSYKCNEYKNLVCRSTTSTCQCFDEYYYWNNTMCVYGNRYGEQCGSSSQCTPTTAGFVCDYPYTGALFTVCRCAIGTKYYDMTTETCQNLKSINSTCRDNSECSGSTSNLMFCGSYEGGSQRVCQCVDGYYWNGANCVIKIAYNVGCTYSYQCNDHLNQTCLSSTSKCGCSTGQYYNTTDYTCQYKKYKGDSCSAAAECWSGTCTSSYCT